MTDDTLLAHLAPRFTNRIPIYLKTGVEYDEVLDAVVEQLRCVAGLISSGTN